MPRISKEHIVLGVVLLLILLLAIGLLMPAYSNGKPPDHLRYSTNLRIWLHGAILTYQEIGSLPVTFHLLHDDRYLSHYPSQLVPYGSAGLNQYKPVRDTQITTFGQYAYEQIQHREIDAVQLKAVAEGLELDLHSWEYIDGFWFSRVLTDWLEGSQSTLVAIGRVPRVEGKTWCFLGWADGHVESSPAKLTEAIEQKIERDRAAREHLGLAPFPPEFESWLLTGEPTSVGDGTFVPPMIQKE